MGDTSTARFLEAESVGVPIGGAPPEIVLIGASTGGPNAVERIVSELPHSFPVPIAVCQHMPPGFTAIWADSLDHRCHMSVSEATHGQRLEPGNVYIAPIGKQMQLAWDDGETTVSLHRDFADSLHVPSIDIFMSSAARTLGSRAMGVLLTGLGSDGALGMLALRRAGAHTVCQCEESSVATSMPAAARELGAVAEEAHIDKMAHLIAARVSGRA